MKSIIVPTSTASLIRITLSFLFLYFQLALPLNDLLAASNSVELGVVSTPESQQISQPAKFPYIPGDAILLSSYPDTTTFLNGIYSIDDQGFVEFPIGDRVKVSNMNEETFLKYLRDNYQNYMRSPNLYVKPMIRVSVVGGFMIPGMYYVDSKMSLWDLIRLAGGPSHEEAIKDLNWERNGEKVIDDLTPFLEHGVSLRNMGCQSGDLIWTPAPEAVDSWEFVTTRVLPVAAFATSLYLMWISYQTMILIARGR
jgi:protein involved in polysaccharide export with SLBB domain